MATRFGDHSFLGNHSKREKQFYNLSFKALFNLIKSA